MRKNAMKSWIVKTKNYQGITDPLYAVVKRSNGNEAELYGHRSINGYYDTIYRTYPFDKVISLIEVPNYIRAEIMEQLFKVQKPKLKTYFQAFSPKDAGTISILTTYDGSKYNVVIADDEDQIFSVVPFDFVLEATSYINNYLGSDYKYYLIEYKTGKVIDFNKF